MGSDRKNSKVATGWILAGLGAEFTGILLFHIFLFTWLDEMWNTKPWMLLIGVILGFSLGIYHLVQRSKSVEED